MAEKLKFGECLRSLLSISGISINRLSKAINVDSSLVNRWVNEKRIPPYNSTYIDKISEYISGNINNSFQIQHLNELFTLICENADTNTCTKDKIKEILSEAQGYSKECRKYELKGGKVYTINKELAHLPLYSYKTSFEQADNIEFKNIEQRISPTYLTDLSSEDKMISGSENILSAILFLLETASGKKPGNNNNIYISSLNDFDLANLNSNSLEYYRNALSAAVLRGWNIVHLIRLNNDIDRTIRFISFALPLMETGRFYSYYSAGHGNLSAGNELLTIPETGALVCFPTKPNSEIDHAFLLKNAAAADILCSYFNTLVSSFAEPLLKYYSLDNILEYDSFLTENVEKIGSRFSYSYRLCISLLPEKLYKKLLKRKKLSYSEIMRELEFYNRQVNAFLTNIHNYEYKDIYLMESITSLVKTRRFYFYCNSEIESMDLSARDIIELLQNIMCLLETYDNYNFAFVPQNFYNNTGYVDFSYMVKERQALMFESYIPSCSIPEVRLSIEEPLVVKAFDEYFHEVWDQIAPENKDKKNVIAWIQQQIDLLME